MPNDIIDQQAATRADAIRIADHREALKSLRLLGQPLEAPDPVPLIDIRRIALVDLYTRDWQEFEGVAAVQFAASAELLKMAREASVLVYGEGV